MILLDYSQVALANLHQQIRLSAQVEPDVLRHMILNSIRKSNREFRKTYGEMVLCTDNEHYWRKDYFKYYKAHRQKDRDESGIDWPLVFDTLHVLRDEIRETFPYKVLDVPMAEADDVIAVIAKYFHPQENILILSGDYDFMQLQIYPGVSQYAPASDQFLQTTNPALFLKEHIIRGDRGDGIPNFLSADDVLVTEGVRQSSVRETKLAVWLTQEPEEFCDERTLANYRRNETLVDLNKIPADVVAAILEAFDKPLIGNRSKIYPYLFKHRMKNLLGLMHEF